MKYKLKVYSIWEFGQRKDSQGNPHQEDSMFPEYGKQSDEDRLFILCDGMGGHDAGEVASATVCEAMSGSILSDGHDKEGIFTSEDFSTALDAAFDALDMKDNGAEKKMGTTMTFLKLHDNGAFIAYMGDSRVYQIRSGKTGEETQIVFQTEDHSLVNDLIKIGELTKEEARFSKQKNVITRAMQPNMGRRPKADVYETSDIKAGDYFYMCSDGMLEQAEMENGESLKNIFSEMGGSDENKVEILKSVTEKNRDNHTAFIIHILEVEEPIEETVTEKTSSPVLNDKFTAIVEEEPETAESESENTQTDSLSNQETKEGDQTIQPQEVANLPIEKSNHIPKVVIDEANKNTAVKRTLYSNVIKFLGAAFVVLLIIIGFNYFHSCTKDKDKIGKETIELPDETTPSTNRPRHNPPKKGTGSAVSNGNTTSPSTQTAVDAANSTAANQLDASETSSQNPTTGTSSIQFPTKPTEGVVESDQQLIQNIKK